MNGLKKLKSLIVFFLILLFLADIVSATFISINTDITDMQIEGEFGMSSLSVRNLGDEAAFDVGLSFLLPQGFDSDDIFVGRLNPDEGAEKEFILSIEGDILAGVYPAALVVSYKDANSYPFSAIAPFKIIQGSRTTSNVFGVFDEVTLAGDRKEKLTLSIKNPDTSSHDLSVNLYIPIELNTVESQKELFISPSSEGKVDFEISSFSALPGSTYAVFASITHEEAESAYSTFARGTIKIEEEKPFLSNRSLGAVLILLLFILLFYQFRGRK
jgi:hypothetical protein